MIRAPDATFPASTWKAGRSLWRIHRRCRDPWWFGSGGLGRFDPVGVGGLGACYLTVEPLGAFLEVFRSALELHVSDVRERVLSELRLRADLRLANVCSRHALTHGVTAQLGADGDYAASQEFAAAVAGAGFNGVRWWVRHDPAQKLVGVALFGPAGTPTDTSLWPPAHTSSSLPDELVARAGRAFGYRVLPEP